MPKAGNVYVDVEANGGKFLQDLDHMAQSAGRSLSSGLGRSARKVVGDLGSSVAAGTKLVAAFGGAAAVASTRFNKGMSGVGAVASATTSELAALREAALEAGAATSFSATEASQAEAELARAGVEVADILGGALRGSLDLAAAGQLELADAAEISAQALKVFKLEGSQTGHVADVLAAGANKSAADVGQLGDALRQGGLVASQYGIGLEQTVGTLAAFADRALIGSDAGTSFKTMLQRLVPVSGPAKEAMDSIGFSAFDAQGNFVGLESVAQQLQEGLKDLSDEQRSAALTAMFGSDAVRAATVLFELGATGVRDYTDAVNDQGAAQRMAAEQLDNLAGDIEQFSGASETALIRAGDLGQRAMREFVQGGTDLVNVFNDFATTPAWDRIQIRIDQLFDAGELTAGVAERIAAAFEQIDPADIDRAFDRIEDGRDMIRGIAEDLEGLTGLTVGLGGSFASMALRSIPIIGQFAPAISPITGALGGLLLGTEGGREGLETLGDSMLGVARDAGPEVLDSLGEVADELGEGLGEAIGILSPAIADAATRVLPLFADALADIAPAAGEFLTSGAELTAEVLPELVTLLEAGAPVLGVLTPALELGADAMGVMADNADILIPLLAGLGAVKLAGFVRDLQLMSKLGGGLNSVVQPLTNIKGALAGTEQLRRTTQMGIALNNIGTGLKSFVGANSAAIALAAVTAAVAKFNSEIAAGKEQASDWVRDFTDDVGVDLATANYAQLTSSYQSLKGAAMDWQEVALNDPNPLLRKSAAEARDQLMEEYGAYEDLIGSADRLSGQIGTTRNESLGLIREQERLGAAFGTNAGLADSMRRELDKLTGGKLSAQEATIQYEQAVDNLAMSLELNGNSVDASTQAGRDNLNAIRDQAEAAHEFAAATIEESGNVDAATWTLTAHANQLRDVLEAAGLTEEQIDELLGTYGLLPDQIQTAVSQVGAQKAAAEVQALQGRLNGLPDRVRTYLQALIDRGSYVAAERALNNLGRPRTIRFDTSVRGPSGVPLKIIEAAGGVVDYFGTGGFSERHVAQIAPAGAMRVWAEPETGGEAYIPLGGGAGQRQRSLDIWAETGERLGVGSAAGVVIQFSPGAIVVNPSKGMSEREVGEAVYREFATRARSDPGFLTKIKAAVPA